METRNPLDWPLSVPRTPADERREALFRRDGKRVTFAEARNRLAYQVGAYSPGAYTTRAHLDDVMITTDVPLRRSDGQPRADRKEPPDPGVVVYFTLDGLDLCLPCDTFTRAADNLAAIAGHIEADRAQERYGVATVRQRFASFLALPAAGQGSGVAWWAVLGVERGASEAELRRAYRRRLMDWHPDRNDHPDARARFEEVQEAWAQAKQARGIT